MPNEEPTNLRAGSLPKNVTNVMKDMKKMMARSVPRGPMTQSSGFPSAGGLREESAP